MSRLVELAAKRQALLARSAALRLQLIDEGRDLDVALASVDRGIGLFRSAASSPLLMTAAAGGLLLLVKPRNVLRFASRAMLVTSLVRKAGALLRSKVAPHHREGLRERFRRK